jgi:hypothetical protein
MHINDTQQKHSYHDFVQKFSFLFDKIKKEDESIHTAVASFNVVKFLIERSASWNKDKDEVYEVFQKEFKNMKEAKQELQKEAKEVLSKYIGNDVEKVPIEGVSIYGNCAEVKLKADKDKNEFKISEFLNSDFCTNNKISGFSTLHDNGKSGMHGVVSGGIRHYVVTDGSYEMTLKWYAEGKECEITINIDANGIDFVKGDDFSLERLEANQDVKIGGLFLHQIQFREKGKENEVQHGKGGNQIQHKTYETVVRSDGRNIGQDIGVKFSRNRRLSYDSGIEEDFNNEINSQEDPQNKRTPPRVLPRTSSLPPEKGVLNEQRRSTLIKSVSQNQEDGQKDERFDNPTFTTFGHALPGSQKPGGLHGNEQENSTPEVQQQSKTQQQKKGHQSHSRPQSNSEGDLSVKSTQSSTLSDDSSRPLSPVSTDGNKESLIDAKQSDQTPFENLLKEIRDRSQQDNRGLRKVGLINKSPQNKDESELQEKFSQEKHGLKPADQKGMSKQTRERLLEDGLLKDSLTDVKTVAEQENADTNLTIDKNRELSKLLEKDETQLKVGVIEEEREDTLAEHTNSHDRNRIALANRNKRPLGWAKRIAESQQEKDTKGTQDKLRLK